jgi:phage shock protein A
MDASFDEGNSLSNAPSRYMDTLEQLTSELADAYQKINELTQKISTLEEENKSLSSKSSVDKQNSKFAGGIFNSFFKK